MPVPSCDAVNWIPANSMPDDFGERAFLFPRPLEEGGRRPGEGVEAILILSSNRAMPKSLTGKPGIGCKEHV